MRTIDSPVRRFRTIACGRRPTLSNWLEPPRRKGHLNLAPIFDQLHHGNKARSSREWRVKSDSMRPNHMPECSVQNCEAMLDEFGKVSFQEAGCKMTAS